MTTEKIDGATVTTQASVYFGGKCVSHTLTFPDGSKKCWCRVASHADFWYGCPRNHGVCGG